MTGDERVYLDTNILIRIVEGRDEASELLLELLLKGDQRSPPVFLTSELTSAETLVGAFRQKDAALIENYMSWSVSNSYLEVAPAGRTILHAAALLRATHETLKLPDAIHPATALLSRCTLFLSADQRLANDYRLKAARLGLPDEMLALAVIRPTPDRVDHLLEALS